MTRRCLAAGVLAYLLVAPAVHGAEGLYLHVVETAAPEGRPAPDRPWRVELILDDLETAWADLPAELGAERGPGTDRVVVDMAASRVIGGTVRAQDTEASFVVDFDEPSVVALRESLVARRAARAADGRPSIAELIAFTDESITHKTSARAWDFASRVAREAEGDCTEHAVLLAALARSFGYPARVATGLALVLLPMETGDVGAFGHAWAEIHDGDAWRVADATRIEEDAEAVRLLPLTLLTNEGPGYQAQFLRQIRLQPRHVEIRPAGAED